MINEISMGTCSPPPNVLQDQSGLPPAGVLAPSPLSFSLISAHEGSLVDLIAPDESRWADWTDGLTMLRRDGGHAQSNETAGFVAALTEIGLKIKLLGKLLSFLPPHCTSTWPPRGIQPRNPIIMPYASLLTSLHRPIG